MALETTFWLGHRFLHSLCHQVWHFQAEMGLYVHIFHNIDQLVLQLQHWMNIELKITSKLLGNVMSFPEIVLYGYRRNICTIVCCSNIQCFHEIYFTEPLFHLKESQMINVGFPLVNAAQCLPQALFAMLWWYYLCNSVKVSFMFLLINHTPTLCV